MTSLRNEVHDHEGVFVVSEDAVPEYIDRVNPQVLRNDKRFKSHGRYAINFGSAKGLQFDHVLIVPTKPIREYLTSGDLSKIKSAQEKLHVAVTRARHSVAFVLNEEPTVAAKRWTPE